MPRYIRSRGRVAGAFALVVVACAATSSAVAQDDSAQPEWVMLDRKAAARLLLNQVKPEYPALAKLNFIQGRVRLAIRVTPQGHVGEVHVVHGHPFLAVSALKAIRRWVYIPLMKGAAPTAFQTFVDVNFSLRRKKIDEFPAQPEQDLTQRVLPPEVLEKPLGRASTPRVRMRVLVSDVGRVIDSSPLSGMPGQYHSARKDLERWTFRPARWGTLSVPWYLDVDVPVENLPPGAREPGGR